MSEHATIVTEWPRLCCPTFSVGGTMVLCTAMCVWQSGENQYRYYLRYAGERGAERICGPRMLGRNRVIPTGVRVLTPARMFVLPRRN